jgi:hypothetical protein
MEQCKCSQEERTATGWGFRLANWSTVANPILILVHFGCDRPLYGHGRLRMNPVAPISMRMRR